MYSSFRRCRFVVAMSVWRLYVNSNAPQLRHAVKKRKKHKQILKTQLFVSFSTISSYRMYVTADMKQTMSGRNTTKVYNTLKKFFIRALHLHARYIYWMFNQKYYLTDILIETIIVNVDFSDIMIITA